MIEELENTLNKSEKISIEMLETYTGIKSDVIKSALKLDDSVKSISQNDFRENVSEFVKLVFEKNQ